MLFVSILLALHLSPVAPPAPNRQPQLAAAGNTVAMVFAAGDAIWVARSSDGGRSFSPPSRIAGLPKLMAGRHRGPRVAFAGSAILVTAIAADSDLLCWHSTDGGRTWSKPATINDSPKSTREGLHAMAADAAGHVAAVWLDLRAPKGTELYGSFSNDGGATWSPNVRVYHSPDGTICQCCHPSLAALGNGEFEVMWRNVLAGSRDLYTLRLRDGKPVSEAVKLGQGTWKLDACPMDGGGLAARDGAVWSAWRRESEIYLTAPGKPEVKLGAGKDLALALTARGPYAVWSTPEGITAMLPGTPSPRRISDTGAFPAVVALPDGSVLAAWEEKDSISVHRIE